MKSFTSADNEILRPGDKCIARYSQDKLEHEAVVLEIFKNKKSISVQIEYMDGVRKRQRPDTIRAWSNEEEIKKLVKIANEYYGNDSSKNQSSLHDQYEEIKSRVRRENVNETANESIKTVNLLFPNGGLNPPSSSPVTTNAEVANPKNLETFCLETVGSPVLNQREFTRNLENKLSRVSTIITNRKSSRDSVTPKIVENGSQAKKLDVKEVLKTIAHNDGIAKAELEEIRQRTEEIRQRTGIVEGLRVRNTALLERLQIEFEKKQDKIE